MLSLFKGGGGKRVGLIRGKRSMQLTSKKFLNYTGKSLNYIHYFYICLKADYITALKCYTGQPTWVQGLHQSPSRSVSVHKTLTLTLYKSF